MVHYSYHKHQTRVQHKSKTTQVPIQKLQKYQSYGENLKMLAHALMITTKWESTKIHIGPHLAFQ